MNDILLQKFFETERWEKAIEIGVDKKIDKGELRKLCHPYVRAELYEKIKNDQYEIAPPHIALIPKDKPGEFREVYINENIDRLFLSITNELFFELFPEMIHPACKSYQKGIGCGKVVQQVAARISKSKPGVIVGWKSDLSKYFDTVKIEYIDEIFDRMEKKIGKSKIIDIVRTYYHTDWCFDTEGNLIQRFQSLKQGCAVASFLADAVLYHIDDELSKMDGIYVRYSDDCLFVGNGYGTAMDHMQKALWKMEMKLNPKKVEAIYSDKWFKFLGFSICGNKISISKGRLKDFQKEIEARTIKKRDITPRKAINAVNRYLYIGDGRYSWATSVLPIINTDEDIEKLNIFVMDCIRAVMTNKKKVGGLGYENNKQNGVITRGIGKNVTANRIKTEKDITGYYSISCMRNAMLSDRAVYDTLVRTL